jgi:hypothetical protein
MPKNKIKKISKTEILTLGKEYSKMSKFFIKTNLEFILIKRDIEKMPDCIQKYLYLQKYQKLNKIISTLEMEFSLLKYISSKVDNKVKMDIDFNKYFFSSLKVTNK